MSHARTWLFKFIKAVARNDNNVDCTATVRKKKELLEEKICQIHLKTVDRRSGDPDSDT